MKQLSFMYVMKFQRESLISTDVRLFDFQAVQAAKQAWGAQRLEELDAEEKLSFACEKATTDDRITLQLRAAYKVRQTLEFQRHTSEEIQLSSVLFPNVPVEKAPQSMCQKGFRISFAKSTKIMPEP